MPNAPRRYCAQPGCPFYAVPRSQYCTRHRLQRAERAQADEAARHARYDKGRPDAPARGYDAAWRAVRDAVLNDCHACAYCPAKASVVHHLLPVKQGGTHDRTNLVALCASCHQHAHARRCK